MNVEIISVGTELLLGEIVNTNAVELMQMCKELGFNVYHQVTVGDNPERLKQALQEAFARQADLVITTGGLGPTNDDLTKQICSQYLGCPLFFREDEAQKIHAKLSFLMQGGPIAWSNYQQAYFPREAIILENDVGTANGCLIKKGKRMIANLPGPPREMRYVMNHSLRPLLESYCMTRLYTKEYVVLTTGESQLQDELADLLASQQEVTLALYAPEGYVRLRLATRARFWQEANTSFAPMEQALMAILGDRLSPLSALEDVDLAAVPEFRLQCEPNIDFLDDWCQDARIAAKLVSSAPNHLHLFLQPDMMGEYFCMEAQFGINTYQEKLPCLKQARYNTMRIQRCLTQFLIRIAKEMKGS